LGRIGFGIAPSDPSRMYATVDADKFGGVFRSDDAGESWKLMSKDIRLWGRGSDFAEIKVHPKNPDVVFSIDVDAWKSEDGGNTWAAFRGAPGGDDYHRLWINPEKPEIMLLAGDQGGIVTVNGGESFSSWYNQATAQFYHVSTDNAFPYNVYGGQQESGSVGIASRGNDGIITFRDWHPVGVEEYGYVAADPQNPNIIYGGKITRYDKRTGQTQNVAPESVRSGKYRFIRTAPVMFSPIDPKTLYFAGNVLFKTQDEGNSWQVISPDLTRETYDEIPESIGIYKSEEMKKMARRGVIYALAPSPKDINTIWAGTDDGLIHVTKDGGKTWKKSNDVGAWSKVSQLEASHFEVNTAYAAINRIRLDDQKPHIFRTKDGGKTWQEIVKGLPNDPINTVREDPTRKGLLFAGSERAIYVSFDDGENWQSLRQNMPATSIRDLVIKDDDIVVGTHGRSFWILDNITPLRQISIDLAKNEAILFKPQTSYRVRYSLYTDTPITQEEAAGQNPPDGAMIDYFLKEKAQGEVVMEIFDGLRKPVRRFSSNDKPYEIPDLNIPLYWIRPQQMLSGEAGSHRFLWDFHYKPLNLPPTYPISAVYQNTAPDPTSPWAMVGNYTVKLTVNGKTYSQNFALKIDPRVATPIEKLQQQHDLSVICYEGRKKISGMLEEIGKATKTAQTSELEGKLNKLNNNFTSIFNILHDSDTAPTTQTITAVSDARKALKELVEVWEKSK
jgi:photosystem II stability/assembly factor-like uncharacterized protein